MMGLNPTGLFHQTTSKTATSAHSKYLLSGRRECLNLILDKLSSSKGTREASGFFQHVNPSKSLSKRNKYTWQKKNGMLSVEYWRYWYVCTVDLVLQ